MRRFVSLLVVVSVVSALACAGEEAWPPRAEPSSATLSLTTEDGGTADGGSSVTCLPAEPPVPAVPEPTNLDTWDFGGTPLLPTTSTTRSLYLVVHLSPVDRTRLYVYGIDVVAQRFIFVGTLARSSVARLTQRAGIDIGNYVAMGGVSPSSGISIQIEGPAPPPPPPGIHDLSIQNYAQIAWHAAVVNDQAVQTLHN